MNDLSEKQAQKEKENDSDSEDGFSDNEESKTAGTDALNAPAYDIPRVDDIPVISKLAKLKEREKVANMDGAQQVQYQKDKRLEGVTKVIEGDADQLETHFVENPFIKIREKAAKKEREGKVILAGDDLEMEAQQNKDVYVMEDSGKMHVQDLETIDREKNEKKKNESDADTDEEAEVKKGSSRQLRKEIKTFNLQKKSSNSMSIFKNKSMTQQAKRSFQQSQGHNEKFTGGAYKSAKGKGDVLKAGKLEPFSYIQLNPKMINRRHKAQAVKSFSKVVNFGKKADKR